MGKRGRRDEGREEGGGGLGGRGRRRGGWGLQRSGREGRRLGKGDHYSTIPDDEP